LINKGCLRVRKREEGGGGGGGEEGFFTSIQGKRDY
jgi:hypothetical protein